MQDIILTGVPRSGTSLVCQLLNQCADTVAVSEPPIPIMDSPPSVSHLTISNGITAYFQEVRHILQTEKTVVSRHINGEIPSNYFEPYDKEIGVRRFRTETGMIRVEKPLSDDFTLCIKHPAPFTALLATLVKLLPCYAIVRNPLAVLASWNSVDVPVGTTGHVPAAERLDMKLAVQLEDIPEKSDRQLFLLDWFFKQYQTILPDHHILRYEQLIQAPHILLSAITPTAQTLNAQLDNLNKKYDKAYITPLAEKLLDSEGTYWRFYSKDDVHELLLRCS